MVVQQCGIAKSVFSCNSGYATCYLSSLSEEEADTGDAGDADDGVPESLSESESGGGGGGKNARLASVLLYPFGCHQSSRGDLKSDRSTSTLLF